MSDISYYDLFFCTLSVDSVKTNNIINVRNFEGIDNELLSQFLDLQPFENISIQDINEKIAHLNTIILNIFKTFAPCYY